MKKIERITMMNRFRKSLLAYILIIGFALFYNASFSYAFDRIEQTDEQKTDEQKTDGEERSFSDDMAEGTAFYRVEGEKYVAETEDGRRIVRRKDGSLESIRFGTGEKAPRVECKENKEKAKNVNWFKKMMSYNMRTSPDGIGMVSAEQIKIADAIEEDATMARYCTFFDSEGQPYKYEMEEGGLVEDKDHALNQCKPMPLKMAELTNCYLCPLLLKIFQACDSLGDQAMNAFSVTIRKLLAIGLALYLAFSVLTHISSFVKVDAAKFWQGVFTQSFKVLIAFFMLTYTNTVYDYIVSPILTASLEYGAAIMEQIPDSNSIDASRYLAIKTKRLDFRVYKELINYMVAIQAGLSTSQAIGFTLICASNSDAIRDLHTIMNFQMFFQGLIIYIFSLFLSIAFAFYLIDSIARLGILFALLPLLITAWPFKLTSGYVTKGVNILLNAAFTFIFMGTMASLIISLIDASLGTNQIEIIKVFNDGTPKEVEKLFDMTGIQFLILIATSIFGFQYMSTVVDFARNFSSYSGPPQTAPKIAGRAASVATNAVSKTTAPATKYVGEKAGQKWNQGIDTVKRGLGLDSNHKNAEGINFNQSEKNSLHQVKPQTQPSKPVDIQQQKKQLGSGQNGNDKPNDKKGDDKENNRPKSPDLGKLVSERNKTSKELAQAQKENKKGHENPNDKKDDSKPKK